MDLTPVGVAWNGKRLPKGGRGSLSTRESCVAGVDTEHAVG